MYWITFQILDNTFYIKNEPMIPTKSNHVETLTQFGPNFQIRMAIMFYSFPTGQPHNVIDVTKGLDHVGPGSRYPALWITKEKILACTIYYDGNKHEEGGHYMPHGGIELDKVYYIVMKLENGLFQYIVNGEEVGSIHVENPLTYNFMKLYLTHPWYETFDGIFMYFHLDGNPGKFSKLSNKTLFIVNII